MCHSLRVFLRCRSGISMPLFSPAVIGIELARPPEYLSTPPARRCRLRCFFKYDFSHCCGTMYHSQAVFLMLPPPLSTASSPRSLQRWPDGRKKQRLDDTFLRPSRRPSSSRHIHGVRVIREILDYLDYTKSQHACWSYKSCRKGNHFSLNDGFRPVSPPLGCCGCFNNLIVPYQSRYS